MKKLFFVLTLLFIGSVSYGQSILRTSVDTDVIKIGIEKGSESTDFQIDEEGQVLNEDLGEMFQRVGITSIENSYDMIIVLIEAVDLDKEELQEQLYTALQYINSNITMDDIEQIRN